jgi:GNAT superfamily N-acetyltransferase
MSIPDAVVRAAIFPDLDLPVPPPEHPFDRIDRVGYSLGVFRGATLGSVSVQKLAQDDVERTLAETREFFVERGIERVAWMIPDSASPSGLAETLRSRGLVPYEEPPLESRFAAMALVEPPPAGPGDVDARRVRTFEEFQAGSRVQGDAFAVSEEDRAAFEAQQQLLWRIQSEGGHSRSFIAVIDGEVVGCGGAILGANAVYLSGGSTRADARGRGVYRALVRARWDEAIAAGTPALTVGAGKMSRPILERLGFTNVGWSDCLLDRLQ